MVPNSQHQRVRQCPGTDLDRCGAVFDGVFQQVDQHPFHQHGIELDQRKIVRDVSGNPIALQRRLRSPNRRAHHLFGGLPLTAKVNRAVLQPRHVQQIGNQRAELPRLLRHGFGCRGAFNSDRITRACRRQ